MSRLGVMHLVDSLAMGGTERVAVNLVNALSGAGYAAHLCTTRKEGPLAPLVATHVPRLQLARRSTWDFAAITRLVQYIRTHEIRVLHAHASSILVANLASRWWPYPRVVWHDHYGVNAQAERSPWLYRLLTARVRHVLAVSQPLVQWARERLHFPAERVHYVPNFVCESEPHTLAAALPGESGRRIVCVANVRPVKDHLTLVRALAEVRAEHPSVHLLLVGGCDDENHVAAVRAEIERLNLSASISLLGPRTDVAAILAQCDLAVLSSAAEGLPLSLLEYGMAGLPVICTNVGQCADVLDQGHCGVLVPSQQPAALAQEINTLLAAKAERNRLATAFQTRVRNVYSAQAVLGQITELYDALA
jgi:glycosyltransferase involved in cell wall biosynthesis